MLLSPIKLFLRASGIEKTCLFMGIILVFRYAWLLDDAYVYFRYIDNLLIHGFGLVYNKNEFVEGFSSPAWMIALICLRAMQINYWHATLAVGAVCYATFWYCCLLITRRFSHCVKETAIVNAPLVYLTCTYGVMCYFTSGTESPLVLVAAAAYALLYAFPANRFALVVVGISPLIRHELLMPFTIAAVWLWAGQRRFPWLSVILCITSMGSYELFRLWYYADLFPNTFYLKDTIWISQGFNYVLDAIMPYNAIPLLGLSIVAYAILRKKHGPHHMLENQRAMMLISAISVLVYVVKIGGDPRHFRFMAFPFALIALSSAGLAESALAPFAEKNRVAVWSVAALAALLFLSAYPRQLQYHPLDESRYSHQSLLGINDGSLHKRRRPYTPEGFAAPYLSYSEANKTLEKQHSAVKYDQCYWAYLDSNSSVIQGLGLTEPLLARTNMKENRPAHKLGLIPLAQDILHIREKYGFRRGAFDEALAAGDAPEWVRSNIASIRKIEAKAYNTHRFVENTCLALSKIPRIEPKAH